MDKQELITIIEQQHQRASTLIDGVIREKLQEIGAFVNIPHAVIISGIRRSGKSILLRQIEKKHYPEGVHYFTFEDERLTDFTVKDFNLLYEAFVELYGDKKVFFFDEIQVIPKWELFIRRMMDSGYKFFITGSNASMLSQELGTRLTGRHILIELLPYSFREYLIFKKYFYNRRSLLLTPQKARIKNHFNEFILHGGMPEYLAYDNQEMLTINYRNVLDRDIITRYQLKDGHALSRLSLYLFNHFATRITYSSLKSVVGITHTTTISNYVSYLENSYLIFILKQFSYKFKQQHLLPKKVYVIDNGMAYSIALKFSDNMGRYWENTVFLQIRRCYKEFYYYQTKSGKEVDFVIFEGGKPNLLIQVCYSLSEAKTKKREIDALLEAMDELKMKEAFILTDDRYEEMSIDKKEIVIKPVYEWLLGLQFYGEDAQLDNEHRVVSFKGYEGSRLIPCQVSFEFLSDHFDDEEDSMLEIFDKNRAAIEDKAIKKYRRNQLKANGSILLKTVNDF